MDITTGLQGWWKLDEGTGTSVADSSGNANNGTWTGTLGSQWAIGKIGSFSGNFNGTDNYINAGTPATLDITTNITMAAWVKAPSFAGHNEIIDKWGGGGFVFNLYVGGSPAIYVTGGTFSLPNTWIIGTTSIVINTWYHLAVTYDGSTVQFYVNGVAAGATAATGAWASSAAVALGIGQNRAAGWFSGNIDEVRVYSRALTSADITLLYNYPPPPSASLTGISQLTAVSSLTL